MSSQLAAAVLDYGHPDAAVRRWFGWVPRPSLATVALAVCAGLLCWWLYSVRLPWALQRTFIGGYPELDGRISPDGRKVVTSPHRGPTATLREAIVSDPMTGRALFSIGTHSVRSLWTRFSPDSSQLLIGDDESVIELWDVTSGKLTRSLVVRTGLADSVVNPPAAVFSPDGTKIVITGGEAAQLLDARTGDLVRTLDERSGQRFDADRVQFSPDTKLFCVNSHQRQLIIRRQEDGSEVSTINLGPSMANPSFSPDSTMVVAADGNRVGMWSVQSGSEQWRTAPLNAAVRSITFSPDGQRLWITSDKAFVIDASSGAGRVDLKLSGKAGYTAFVFSGDGRYAYLNQGGRCKVIDAYTLTVASAEFGQFLDSFDDRAQNGRIMLLREGIFLRPSVEMILPDGQRAISSIPPAENRGRTDARFLGDWRQVATANANGEIEIWKLRRPEQWWGILALPQCWLALAGLIALLRCALLDLHRQYGSLRMPA